MVGILKARNRKFKKLRRRRAGTNQAVYKEIVRWEDLETAFKSRIRTGFMIKTHKDLNSFWDYAKKIIIARIKNTLKIIIYY